MALLGKLGNYKNTGLLIVRVGLGIMFMLHGYPKLLGGADHWTSLGGAMKHVGINFLPTVWGLLAAATETFGGFLLILGLTFRPVCLLLAFTMLVASLMHLNKGDGLMAASHAIELGIVFTGLCFVGPGKYSVDGR